MGSEVPAPFVVLILRSYSDQWQLLAKAMDDDVRKAKTLKFVHPKDKGKEYIRHYYSMPVNGHTLMGLGQYTNEMDFGDSGTCLYDSNKFNKVGITFSAFFLYI